MTEEKESVNRILRPTAWVFLVRSLSAAASFLMYVLLARTLSTYHFGVITLAMSWLVILGTAGSYGLSTVTTRLVSENIKNKRQDIVEDICAWASQLSLKYGTAATAISVAASLILYSHYSAHEKITHITILISAPILSYTQAQVGVLTGAKSPITAAIIEVAVRPLVTILALAAIMFAFNAQITPALVALIVLQAQIIAAAMAIHRRNQLQIYSNSSPKTERQVWKKIATPIAAMNVLAILMANYDALAIGYFLGPESAGVYKAAAQIATLVSFGLVASNSIMAPIIASKYSSGEHRDLQLLLRISMMIIAPVGIATIIVLVIEADYILSLFGSQYSEAKTALVVLLVGQAINLISGPTGYMMNMTGNQNRALIVFAICALIGLLANIILIPRMGILGAAISYLIVTASWNASILHFLWFRLNLDPSILSLSKR